ncbi:MotA/TolQ/ExbB proton channel family protein [Kordiimonas sp.]|uniref:MotA/TolQ/ExbB proton channel family protein n=1 Tax=Kordiimonas sp. TaxID=1970157 RepID=UPI003A94A75D
MNKSLMNKAIWVMALIFSALIVNSVYTLMIEPQAALDLQQAAETGQPAPRTWSVLLKDTEQQVCIVLFIWAMAGMGSKALRTRAQSKLLGIEYIPREENEIITPEKAATYYRFLKSLEDPAERDAILPQMLITSLSHFNGTRDIGSATSVAHQVSDLKADHMEAELSLVRYAAWAIPSVGFIGTVRGIGAAMSQAGEALNGNITGVTESLGVAFNSTLVALFLSVILMLAMHGLQMYQDGLIQKCNEYCQRHLLSHLGLQT